MKPFPPVGQVARETWELVKRRYGALASISLLSTFVVPALAAVVAGIWVLPGAAVSAGADGSVVGVFLMSLGALLAAAVLFVGSMLCASALYGAALTEQKVGALLRAARGDWRSYAWVAIVSAFLMGGFILLGFFPGVFLFPIVVLAPYAFKADGAKGFAALLRARDVLKGRWWGAFGRLLLFFVVIQAPLMFLPQDAEELTIVSGVTLGISALYAAFVASPAITALGAVMYRHAAAAAHLPPTKAEGRRWKYAVPAAIGWLVVAGGTVVALRLLLTSFNFV